MHNSPVSPSPTRGKFDRWIFVGCALLAAATPERAAADVIRINAAIVCKADLPQNVVSLGTSVNKVHISGSIALWDVAPTGLSNGASEVTLHMNNAYSMALANGTLPPVIPFLSDVRCVRQRIP